MDVKAGKGKGVYKYTMAVSPLDCMGCGVCVGVCPVKALTMVGQEEEAAQQDVFNYCVAEVAPKADMQDNTVKGSQFKQPYLEFSGSCAGCAETSYARLVTQLFGDRMYISNATGCSSIWGGPAATSPYCTDKNGRGPAWANSLFEDNAEHGLGMYLGQEATRNRLADLTRQLIAVEWARPETMKEAAQKWLDTMTDGAANKTASADYIKALESSIATVDELAGIEQFKAHAQELKAKGEKFCDCDACKLAGCHPEGQGISGEEVHLDLRRRRLGLRHRLRRRGSRSGLWQGRQRLRLRYRGLLQHRRTGFQVLQHRPGGTVRRCR